MAQRSDTLLRFVRAVRRRMVLLRLVERAGVAMAAGSAVGLILAAVLIYRGQGAGEPLAVLLGLAAVAGIIWGLTNRPTVLAAAEEADRQLDLADLFATALSLGPAPFDQDFARTVHNLAAQRAGELSPSALVLRKLTGRAWSGIGLTTALALAAGLLSSRPSLIQAQDDSASPFVALNRLPAQDRGSAARPAWPGAARPPRPQEQTSGSDNDRFGTPDPAPDNDVQVTRTGDGHAGQSTAPNGQGPGQSSTPNPAQPSTPAGLSPTDAASSDPNGQIASGAGRSTTGAQANDPGAQSASGAPSGRAPTPPWRSADWESRRTTALHEADQSPIPDAYRGLIRDYFSAR